MARSKRSRRGQQEYRQFSATPVGYQTHYHITRPKGVSVVHRLACASSLHLLEVWARVSYGELTDHVLRFNGSGLTEKERLKIQVAAQAMELSRKRMREVKLGCWGLKDS